MRLPLRVGAVLAALVGTVALAGPAAATDDPPGRPDGGPLLGAILDWGDDTADAYRDRLGQAPAFYAWEADYPLDDVEGAALDSALRQAAAEGAGLMVVLTPEDEDTAFDPSLPDQLVGDLRKAGAGGDVPVWLNLFPEMNAPWYAWGQEPSELVPAYRAVADAVHDELPGTAMVWQPAYAAGYPFGGTPGSVGLDAGAAEDDATDTDGDGRLTSQDDPYGPYFPGAEYVDWVGAAAYHWGDSYPYGDDDLPLPGELPSILSGTFGAPDRDPQRDLVQRFGVEEDLPVVLETAALWTGQEDEPDGPTELELKSAWFDEVAAELTRTDSPVEALLWREQERPEDETEGVVVDWRATADRDVVRAFRDTVVRGADLTTGPDGADADIGVPNQLGTGTGTTLDDTRSWIAVAVAALLVALLGVLAHSRAGRRLSYDTWAEETGQPESRDLRIDLLRGVAICFVVVNHMHLSSVLSLLTEETVGPFSGAELFVLLSGVVLGSVHAARARAGTAYSVSVQQLWTRAGKLWLTAAVVAVLVWLVAIIPGISGAALTTFTDNSTGQVYDLYGPVRGVADGTAVVRDVVIALFFLDIGPSQLNILGLYVVLLLVAPGIVWLLRRRLWLPLLAVSVVVWLLGRMGPTTIFPSQFEDAFPLLAWQLLFVVGLVLGWHRTRLVEASRSRAGQVVVGLIVLAWFAGAIFSWNNSYLSNRLDVRLSLISDVTFQQVYADWFGREDLGPGRVVAVVCGVLAGYAFLTAFWLVAQRTLAWFLVPMGQNTLYVFVLHVVAVLVAAELAVPEGELLIGTLVDVAALLLLWVCVRTRFLFGIVPR